MLVLDLKSAAVLECDAPPLESRMENSGLKMADIETFILINSFVHMDTNNQSRGPVR